MISKRILPLIAAILLSAPSIVGAEALMEPAKTYALVAGVLQWKDPNLASFSAANRQDQAFYNLLSGLGVPASNRKLLLDREATSERILAELSALVSRAPADSTIVFYYAGHGVRRQDTGVAFASYDMDTNSAESGLLLSKVAAVLKSFKGRRVLLFADCCYSGGLAAVAGSLAGKQVLALTSADASNISTGDWTFSMTLIRCMSGSRICDRNGDGRITVDELALDVKENMRYRASQRYGFLTVSLSGGLEVRDASGPVLPDDSGSIRRNEWRKARRGGETAVVRVLGSKADSAYVSAFGYSDESIYWSPLASLQTIQSVTRAPGTSLDVSWNGQIFEATVVKVEDGFHLITYPGWDHGWDEWIDSSRIVGLHSPGKSAKRVQVEWQGKWWDAVVKSQQGSKQCIHYLGYDDSWDECVASDRIRQ